ncbi:MAG TPA: choice-of-anchor D domain-containing protein [Verrucomicrobiales bacterium]|nr:choice-of-anchor D domain-containing protein [Verrucomicrobiales bacterium]
MLLAFAGFTGLAQSAEGRAGDLDFLFGSGHTASIPGTAIMPFSTTEHSFITNLVLQSDGKIVAAGIVGTHAALTRFHANGTLDLAFGTGGRIEADFGGVSVAQGLAVQANGAILIAGYRSSRGDSVVARYLQDGSPDLSFGQNGIVAVNPPHSFSFARSMNLLSDGKILIAGGAIDSKSSDQSGFLCRFHQNGSLDTGFGQAGFVLVPGPFAEDSAVQIDGKIIVTGTNRTDNPAQIKLTRCNVEGTVDASFGEAGTVTLAPSPDAVSAEAVSLAVQSDGKVVVAGVARDSSLQGSAFLVARFHEDGNPDTTFNGNGRVTTRGIPAGTDLPYTGALSLQSDGKLLVAGTIRGGFALVRYLTGGRLDPEFGAGGIVATEVQEGPGGANAMVLQPDGKIVIGGTSTDSLLAGSISHMAVARYMARDAESGLSMEWPPGFALKSGQTVEVGTALPSNLDPRETTITLRNSGITSLTNVSASLLGPDAAHFAISSAPAESLNPGGTADLTVKFTPLPGLSGSKALLVINSGASGADPVVAVVHGSTEEPMARLTLYDNGSPLPADSMINFGRVLTGQSITKVFIIRNTGNIDLTLHTLSLGAEGTPGDFTVGLPGATQLAGNEFTTFPVTFSPSGPGPRTARLRIPSTDTFNPPYEINLSGRRPTDLESWRLTHFGSMLDDGPGADLSDPDHDSIPNLLEYATLTNPRASNPEAVQLVKNGNLIECRFSRPSRAGPDLAYELESSSSLHDAPWLATGATPQILSDDGTQQHLKFTLTAGDKRSFLRLRVTSK